MVAIKNVLLPLAIASTAMAAPAVQEGTLLQVRANSTIDQFVDFGGVVLKTVTSTLDIITHPDQAKGSVYDNLQKGVTQINSLFPTLIKDLETLPIVGNVAKTLGPLIINPLAEGFAKVMQQIAITIVSLFTDGPIATLSNVFQGLFGNFLGFIRQFIGSIANLFPWMHAETSSMKVASNRLDQAYHSASNNN
ncbi:hypothetical protein CJU90_5636 [Yarrowia sp. C11]|nr:hypothetical protein CJU90_5636 [Yarrowia sp. C11]KAG5364221.1 hypothetical protein CKK34_3013 [Yarrowia sp. E02]